MGTFLEPAECLPRLPVRMSEREFRKRVISQGLCYKHGHQIKLDDNQLQAFIETLKCQTSSSTNAATRGTSVAPFAESALEKARALAAESTRSRRV
jgi:hypothetical protein